MSEISSLQVSNGKPYTSIRYVWSNCMLLCQPPWTPLRRCSYSCNVWSHAYRTRSPRGLFACHTMCLLLLLNPTVNSFLRQCNISIKFSSKCPLCCYDGTGSEVPHSNSKMRLMYLSQFIVSSKKKGPIILWTLMTHQTHIFRSWSGTSSTNSDFSVAQYLLLCDVMWPFRWNKASFDKKIWDQFPHNWLFQSWSWNWSINEIM